MNVIETKVLKLSDIAETGFQTWIEFDLAIDEWGSANNLFRYQYTNVEKKSAEIRLEFSREDIETLSFEEGRALLRRLNIQSFGKLWSDHQDKRNDYGPFNFNVIEKQNDGQLVLKKLRISRRIVDRQKEIEASQLPVYSIYEQPRECASK